MRSMHMHSSLRLLQQASSVSTLVVINKRGVPELDWLFDFLEPSWHLKRFLQVGRAKLRDRELFEKETNFDLTPHMTAWRVSGLRYTLISRAPYQFITSGYVAFLEERLSLFFLFL